MAQRRTNFGSIIKPLFTAQSLCSARRCRDPGYVTGLLTACPTDLFTAFVDRATASLRPAHNLEHPAGASSGPSSGSSSRHARHSGTAPAACVLSPFWAYNGCIQSQPTVACSRPVLATGALCRARPGRDGTPGRAFHSTPANQSSGPVFPVLCVAASGRQALAAAHEKSHSDLQDLAF
jgi:hypothetical protein